MIVLVMPFAHLASLRLYLSGNRVNQDLAGFALVAGRPATKIGAYRAYDSSSKWGE
jgi:hypothetical protein